MGGVNDFLIERAPRLWRVAEGKVLYVDNTPGGYYHVRMISDIKKRALHRSKILEGQIHGFQKMIDEEKYCMDILAQGLAIQKSVASLNKLVLENHIRTHVKDNLRADSKTRQNDAIDELLKLYELTIIKSK